MTLQYARNCIVLTKKKMTLRFWSSLEIFFVLDSRVVVQFLCFFNGKKLLVFIEHLLYSSIWQVPWTARRSNQSILKEINPEYSLERLMLKLKIQYFGHLMRRSDSLEKTLMVELLKAGEARNDRMTSLTQWCLVCCSPWGCKESGTTEWLNNNMYIHNDFWFIMMKIEYSCLFLLFLKMPLKWQERNFFTS